MCEQGQGSGWTARAVFWTGSWPARSGLARSWPDKKIGRSGPAKQDPKSAGPVRLKLGPTERTEEAAGGMAGAWPEQGGGMAGGLPGAWQGPGECVAAKA